MSKQGVFLNAFVFLDMNGRNLEHPYTSNRPLLRMQSLRSVTFYLTNVENRAVKESGCCMVWC